MEDLRIVKSDKESGMKIHPAFLLQTKRNPFFNSVTMASGSRTSITWNGNVLTHTSATSIAPEHNVVWMQSMGLVQRVFQVSFLKSCVDMTRANGSLLRSWKKYPDCKPETRNTRLLELRRLTSVAERN